MKTPEHIAVLFLRLGRYHHARLAAAGRFGRVTGLEIAATDNIYAWEKVEGAEGFGRVTLFDDKDPASQQGPAIARKLHEKLDGLRPDAVAIPGWADAGSLAAADWCAKTGTPALVMSESNAHDEKRSWWREAIKKRIVSFFSAGIVGGRSHEEYLRELGLEKERIYRGYNAVDNAYFEEGAARARKAAADLRAKLGLPENFFLASNRFIDKKNLPALLRAFASYRAQANGGAWDLVLLGDGPVKPELESLQKQLGLETALHMPGFKQYGELPTWYGLARAFVHPATVEPWGLVVNEAMAAGLPVLVSERCGCAPELVRDGKNGFRFDPDDTAALASHMLNLSRSGRTLDRMGQASKEIVRGWAPEAFGQNVWKAAGTAAGRPRRAGLMLRGLLQALIRR